MMIRANWTRPSGDSKRAGKKQTTLKKAIRIIQKSKVFDYREGETTPSRGLSSESKARAKEQNQTTGSNDGGNRKTKNV